MSSCVALRDLGWVREVLAGTVLLTNPYQMNSQPKNDAHVQDSDLYGK